MNNSNYCGQKQRYCSHSNSSGICQISACTYKDDVELMEKYKELLYKYHELQVENSKLREILQRSNISYECCLKCRVYGKDMYYDYKGNLTSYCDSCPLDR